jgi:cytochrome c oxidase subunit 2
MVIAIALVLLVVGTVAFHLLNPWWFTPIASNWGLMDDTVDLTFWVTGAVFVAVNLFMAYAIVRYRHRKGQERRSEYQPEYKKLEWWLTGLTTVGVVAMLAPGLAVWAKFVTVPEDATVVEAFGQQWAWSFRLPGPDGVLGTIDPALMEPANPFGLTASDPKGRDDVLVEGGELHLPIGKPVKVLLRSKDVMHNFTVPQFRVKMDMVPGMVTYVWLTPTRVGAYEILCEELCGVGHFAMRGRVVVDEPGNYENWLARQRVHGRPAEPGDPAQGQAAFATCIACHGARGEGNQTLNAPKLAGQPSWYLERQLRNFKSGVRGEAPGDEIAAQMRAIALTLDDGAMADVVAYVGTLPDVQPLVTVQGNAKRGAEHYRTCAYCHGGSGNGVWTAGAPRLAHMSDWYLLRQLENFQKGLRGRHPLDYPGAQMAEFSKTVSADGVNEDLVAYINTLR